MKRKDISNRLLTITLTASLVAGNIPLTANASDVIPEEKGQIVVEDSADAPDESEENGVPETGMPDSENNTVTDEESQEQEQESQSQGKSETLESETTTPEAAAPEKNETPKTNTPAPVQAKADAMPIAETAEIILKVNEANEVVTTLEEVETQLNAAFGSQLQEAGITVKDWNIYSEVSAVQKRWVPLQGEKHLGTNYPGILEQSEGMYEIGVNRTFKKYDISKTTPKLEKKDLKIELK